MEHLPTKTRPEEVRSGEHFRHQRKILMAIEASLHGANQTSIIGLPDVAITAKIERDALGALAGGVYGKGEIISLLNHIGVPDLDTVRHGPKHSPEETIDLSAHASAFERLHNIMTSNPTLSSFIDFVNAHIQNEQIQRHSAEEEFIKASRKIKVQGGQLVTPAEAIPEDLIPEDPDLDIFISHNPTPYTLLRSQLIPLFMKGYEHDDRAYDIAFIELNRGLSDLYKKRIAYARSIIELKREADDRYPKLAFFRKNIMPSMLYEIKRGHDSLESLEHMRSVLYAHAYRVYEDMCAEYNQKPWIDNEDGTGSPSNLDLFKTILSYTPIKLINSRILDYFGSKDDPKAIKNAENDTAEFEIESMKSAWITYSTSH